MDIRDTLWLSYKDLSEKRVRTALTIVMVVIGVAAIVALTSVTAGINESISSQLNTLGPTSILLTAGTPAGFTIADIAKISSLPNVTGVTPALSGSGYIYAGNQNVSVTIIGVESSGITKLLGQNVSFLQGSLYSDSINPEIVVGHGVAFPGGAGSSQKISVGQTATLRLISDRGSETLAVPVVGVLPTYSSAIIPIDTSIFVSLQAAELLFHRSSFNEMDVAASNATSVNATAALITSIYGSSARVITVASILATVASITSSLGLLFGAIAGVSLLVAAIGIMNIMLIAVYERTHEIGIMKSVGFKNKNVLTIFLTQALIIGIVGGIIGIGLGAAASYGLSAAFSRGSSSTPTTSSSNAGPKGGGGGGAVLGGGGGGGGSSSSSLSFHPVFPPTTIVLALLIAIVVSIVAGLYPAWRASKMEPIDALRSL
ncbi:MAG: ABC transporter permease [Candidatus Micrarchaeota archaeon]|nr:ABC transporter permease [Candidatus Micrarchaeota archaeon]